MGVGRRSRQTFDQRQNPRQKSNIVRKFGHIPRGQSSYSCNQCDMVKVRRSHLIEHLVDQHGVILKQDFGQFIPGDGESLDRMPAMPGKSFFKY